MSKTLHRYFYTTTHVAGALTSLNTFPSPYSLEVDEVVRYLNGAFFYPIIQAVVPNDFFHVTACNAP